MHLTCIWRFSTYHAINISIWLQFLSLLNSNGAFNCEVIRDCYEAFALYCFERYLIACLGTFMVLQLCLLVFFFPAAGCLDSSVAMTFLLVVLIIRFFVSIFLSTCRGFLYILYFQWSCFCGLFLLKKATHCGNFITSFSICGHPVFLICINICMSQLTIWNNFKKSTSSSFQNRKDDHN